MTVWTNDDGLKVPFNLARAQQVGGGVVNTKGNAREMVIVFDTDDLGNLTTAGDTDGREPFLPAGAYIKNASFIVDTAFTSGGATTLTIGLAEADGSVIDADGIDAAVAKTAIDNTSEVVACDGALVGGTANVGSADAFIYFTVASGPYTAGKGKLVIEYNV